jgi:hypothetical protein
VTSFHLDAPRILLLIVDKLIGMEELREKTGRTSFQFSRTSHL